ncbi:zinc transporter ZIP13-like [Uloborus diversus]|uniref:zinc transporter ZIP13-like n=1 Tax=Uloborus diversus TaxID=327109 RepID=UPI0024097988|nr:zinc transporter ZIP13-like [Uloborus diversus]
MMRELCVWIFVGYFFQTVTAEMSAENVVSKKSISSQWYEDFIINGITDKFYQTWILSILASCVIGLSGVVPLVFVPFDSGAKLNQKGGAKFLKLLLSFAVGGLLGDVFLHLLPEAWNHIGNLGPKLHSDHLTLGLWVLLGMFSFVIIEIMFTASQSNRTENVTSKPNLHSETQNGVIPTNSLCNGKSSYDKNCTSHHQNQIHNGFPKVISNGQALQENKVVPEPIHITGYLNLIANSIDNFTHGLAVAGSFLVGKKMGIITTFAILIHEIPHEIGDFAILLKSGFNPWNAAKAQISTAVIGILGAVVALSAESTDKVGDCTSWILPFTSGGFLNIALVNVLPDLIKEKDPWESIKQMLCVCGGIGVMALVNVIAH